MLIRAGGEKWRQQASNGFSAKNADTIFGKAMPAQAKKLRPKRRFASCFMSWQGFVSDDGEDLQHLPRLDIPLDSSIWRKFAGTCRGWKYQTNSI
jgi:hypothetical protein